MLLSENQCHILDYYKGGEIETKCVSWTNAVLVKILGEGQTFKQLTTVIIHVCQI